MPKRKGEPYKKGLFRPKHPEKCLNKETIQFRSKMELDVMMFCDNDSRVLKWSSERVIIPYWNPVEKTTRRYFIDFFIQIRSNTNVPVDYLVEVKPKRQTIPPKQSPKKKLTTLMYETKMWNVNMAKWDAAKKFAKGRGMIFWIMTEDDIAHLRNDNGK